MCPYKICIPFCMCMFKDNSYKNNACVCYLLLCNKWSQNNSWRHIYYLSVSMGQESRHGLPLALSGSLTGYNHLQVQLGRICILVHFVADGRIQGLTGCWLDASMALSCWPEPSLHSLPSMTTLHPTTWQQNVPAGESARKMEVAVLVT